MKSYTKLLTLNEDKNHVKTDITALIKDEAVKSGITEGIILVRCMHTSMRMYIEDNDMRRLEYDGNSIALSITGGKPDLGYWEKVMIDNYNAKKEKNVIMKIIGE